MTTSTDSWTVRNDALSFDSLLRRPFGATTVKRFESSVRADEEGEPATFLELFLSAPNGETWPSSDIQAIRAEIVKIMTATAYPLTVYVRFISSETH